MSHHTSIGKVIAAAAISTAIALTSLAGGAASADGPSKPPNRSTPLLHAVIVDSEHRAIPLKSQAHQPQADGSVPIETLTLNFDKITWKE